MQGVFMGHPGLYNRNQIRDKLLLVRVKMMEHQNRRCLWEQIEEQEENIKDEFVSPIKELTYDEVTEPIEKNVASYELSEMDWAEYLTHFTYLVEGLKDYRDELSKKHSDIDQKICDILH